MTAAADRQATGLAVARGHGLLPAGATLLAGAAVLFFGARTIPVPAILSVLEVRTALSTVACLFFALAALQTLTEPAPALAITSPRSWHKTRALRLSLAVLVCITTAIGVDAGHTSVKVAATVLLLTTEGTLVAALAGVRLAWILPVTHLLAALVFGFGALGQPRAWAFFVADTVPKLALAPLIMAYVATTVWWATRLPSDSSNELAEG